MQSLSSRLARGAFDAAPDAMIIIDGAGTILFANRRAELRDPLVAVRKRSMRISYWP